MSYKANYTAYYESIKRSLAPKIYLSLMPDRYDQLRCLSFISKSIQCRKESSCLLFNRKVLARMLISSMTKVFIEPSKFWIIFFLVSTFSYYLCLISTFFPILTFTAERKVSGEAESWNGWILINRFSQVMVPIK